jgi:hypothetical protein
MKSPFELMERWWPAAIDIFKKYCCFEFLVPDEYFFKASSCGNKIFPISDRFCDLYIKSILNRRSKLNPKIIETLFFYIYRKVSFQLIDIIDEFYYVLIRPLARIRISLLIFGLKIEIIIKNMSGRFLTFA